MKRLGALLALCGGCLYAHEKETHVNITERALRDLASTGVRPDILQLYGTLTDGAWNEDAYLPGYPVRPLFYLGRFYFHFLPELNDNALKQSATCDSVRWGIYGDVCTAITMLPAFRSATSQSGHSWQEAVSAIDANSVPTDAGWRHLGYLIHLLEDLSSPPHTKSSAHPCLLTLFFCDPFEPDNKGFAIPSPTSEYIDFSNAVKPEDFLIRLGDYTRQNYFSARTVFDSTEPAFAFEDDEYIYGQCLPISIEIGTCVTVNGQLGRKIAHKTTAYKLTRNRRDAEIDRVIAHEQFAELAPVAVQAVEALIKFYAPVITIKTDGTPGSSVTSIPAGIDCGATCSSLFVNGTDVQLTAIVPVGYAIQWQGDSGCAGSTATITIQKVTADTTCRVVLSPSSPRLTLTLQGEGSGQVALSSPSGFICASGSCTVSLPLGTSLFLTATADSRSSFVSFSNNFGNLNPVMTTIRGDTTFVVTFAAASAPTITDVLTCPGISVPVG